MPRELCGRSRREEGFPGSGRVTLGQKLQPEQGTPPLEVSGDLGKRGSLAKEENLWPSPLLHPPNSIPNCKEQ